MVVPEGQLIRSMNFAVPVATGLSWFPPLLDAEARRMISVSRVPANSSVLFQLWAIDRDKPQLLDDLRDIAKSFGPDSAEAEKMLLFLVESSVPNDPFNLPPEGKPDWLIDVIKGGKERS